MNEEMNTTSVGAIDKFNAWYSKHLIPDKDTPTADSKTARNILIVAVAAILVLILAVILFLTKYPYYTTGLTVDEFIERFNSMSITSDSETEAFQLLPDYHELTIPEDAKLGGKNVIKFYDDQVEISADVRFGKIVEMHVNAVGLENYNKEANFFNVDGSDYDFLYFFIVYGKVYSVFDPEDTRITDSYAASLQAYAMHYYAQKDKGYGLPGITTRVLGDNTVTYDLNDLHMAVVPNKRTIAESPVWPEISFGSKADDKPIDNVSTADVSAADVVVTPTDAQ